MRHEGEKRNRALLSGTGDHGVSGVIEALEEIRV